MLVSMQEDTSMFAVIPETGTRGYSVWKSRVVLKNQQKMLGFDFLEIMLETKTGIKSPGKNDTGAF